MIKAIELAPIVGLLMTFLASFVKQGGLSRNWNALITVLACGVAGIVTVAATGGFNHFSWAGLLGVVGLVIAASQAAYAAYFKGTATEAIINEKTSLIK